MSGSREVIGEPASSVETPDMKAGAPTPPSSTNTKPDEDVFEDVTEPGHAIILTGARQPKPK
jgi:hypothetical protein